MSELELRDELRERRLLRRLASRELGRIRLWQAPKLLGIVFYVACVVVGAFTIMRSLIDIDSWLFPLISGGVTLGAFITVLGDKRLELPYQEEAKAMQIERDVHRSAVRVLEEELRSRKSGSAEARRLV